MQPNKRATFEGSEGQGTVTLINPEGQQHGHPRVSRIHVE
jgi:hypothetical protein